MFGADDWQGDTPEQAAIREQLRAMVEALPEPHRSVVEMRVWKQWTYQEISDELGMKGRQNAHDHYNRGIGWLTDTLKGFA